MPSPLKTQLGAALRLLVHEREGVEGHLALHRLALLPVLDRRPTGRRPEDGIHRDGHGEEHRPRQALSKKRSYKSK